MAASVKLRGPARETDTGTCLFNEISDNLVGTVGNQPRQSANSSSKSHPSRSGCFSVHISGTRLRAFHRRARGRGSQRCRNTQGKHEPEQAGDEAHNESADPTVHAREPTHEHDHCEDPRLHTPVGHQCPRHHLTVIGGADVHIGRAARRPAGLVRWRQLSPALVSDNAPLGSRANSISAMDRPSPKVGIFGRYSWEKHVGLAQIVAGLSNRNGCSTTTATTGGQRPSSS